MQGKFKTIQEVNNIANDFHTYFGNNKYVVFIAYIHQEKDTINKAVADKLIEIIKKNINAVVFNDIDMSKLVVASSIDKEHEEKFYQILNLILKESFSALGITITIGVGGIYNNIEDITKSYQDSLVSLDYILIKGTNKIIYHNQEVSQNVVYPHKQMDELYSHILHQDLEKIQYTLTDLVAYIKTVNMPLFIARRIAFDLINISYKAVNEIISSIHGFSNKYPIPTELANFHTLDDIINALSNYFIRLYKFIEIYKTNHRKTVIENMIDYIKDYYCDYEFSVQSMADHFGMSLAGISQFFKKNTAQTIIDYSTNLRLNKAKQLLINGDMTLGEIVNNIGYTSTSSFIRKFKLLTGYTPKHFANLNKKKNVSKFNK